MVDAAVGIIRKVAMRGKLLLDLDAGDDSYVPISRVKVKDAISGGDEAIFLGTEIRIVEKDDEGGQEVELTTLRGELHVAKLRISELAPETGRFGRPFFGPLGLLVMAKPRKTERHPSQHENPGRWAWENNMCVHGVFKPNNTTHEAEEFISQPQATFHVGNVVDGIHQSTSLSTHLLIALFFME